MGLLDKIKEIINCKEINAGKITGSSINGMTVSGDFIAVNTDKGHYEIGNKIGRTTTITLDKHTLVFIGGILVEVRKDQ